MRMSTQYALNAFTYFSARQKSPDKVFTGTRVYVNITRLRLLLLRTGLCAASALTRAKTVTNVPTTSNCGALGLAKNDSILRVRFNEKFILQIGATT